MGKNIKLTSTRGIIAVLLTICTIYLFVSDTTKHITEYLTIYTLVLTYMFSSNDEGNKN